MCAWILVVVCIGVLFVTCASISKNKKFDVIMAEALSAFLCLYTAISGVMWLVNTYKFAKCLLFCLIISIIICVGRYVYTSTKKIKFFEIMPVVMEYTWIISRSVIVVACLLSIGSIAGRQIGYSDGNVQIRAWAILNGNTTNEYEISEYRNVASEEYRDFLYTTLCSSSPENFTGKYQVELEEEPYETLVMKATYGNNPVYPSILVLSAVLFGDNNMAGVQTIFLFCILILVDELLLSFGCNWKIRAAITALLGGCPIIVYSCHTTMIELPVALCIVSFLYCLFCKKKWQQSLCVAPVLAYELLDSDVYTIIPMFILILLAYFLYTREKHHILSIVLIFIGFILGFLVQVNTALDDTVIRYRKNFEFITEENIYAFIIITAVVAIVLSLVLFVVYSNRLCKKFRRLCKNGLKVVLWVMSLSAIAAGIIATVVKIIVGKYTYSQSLNITLIAFLCITGVVLIPAIIFGIAKYGSRFSNRELAIVAAFVWTYIAYSVLIRGDIANYYIEAGFMGEFIPVILIMAGIVLNKISEDVSFIIPLISLVLVFFPYTTSIVFHEADTRIGWNNITGVIDAIEGNANYDTVVLLDTGLMDKYYFVLREKIHVPIYPVNDKVLENLYLSVPSIGGNVIYISSSESKELEGGNVLYFNNNTVTGDVKRERSVMLGLPTNYRAISESNICVYEYENVLDSIDEDNVDDLTLDNMLLQLTGIYIDDTEQAHLFVTVTPDSEHLYSNKKHDIRLSYHLNYEGDKLDEFNGARIFIPECLRTEGIEFTYDLKNLHANECIFEIDAVEEGVSWYSDYDNEKDVVPVKFTNTGDGWEYLVQ